MAEQSNSRSGESTTEATEATQPKQTTRFQYPRGDAVIGKFFAANVYKSAALIDVIYLFHLDYGADADVSQILRERLMAARSDNSNGAGNIDSTGNTANTALTPPATKRTVDMPSDTVDTEETESDAVSDEAAEKKKDAAKPEKQQKAESKKQQNTDTAQSNTDKKSSDFNIAEMFD